MLIGILLMLIMLRTDWRNLEDEASEGNRLIMRSVVTFFAVLLWGGSFAAAVLIGLGWGFVGGVIFSMIREDREVATNNSTGSAKKIIPPGEYLVNGHGEITSKLFNANEYSSYTEVERNSEGRILADPSGKIICTKYVTK